MIIFNETPLDTQSTATASQKNLALTSFSTTSEKRELLSRQILNKKVAFIVEQSLQIQIAEYRLLFGIKSLRDRIITGGFSLPKMQHNAAPVYTGCCERLIRLIKKTTLSTLEEYDYNGIEPYLTLLQQLNQGVQFINTQISPLSELPGTTCIGMSHALRQKLKEKHGIESSLGAMRECSFGTFTHAAVIVECSDGYVFIETTNSPAPISIPFEQEREFYGCRFIASKAGSSTPLTVYPLHDKQSSFVKFHTNIFNATDLLIKRFMAGCLLESGGIAAGIYGKNRSTFRKFVLIRPNQKSIILKDMEAHNGSRTKEISFQEALKGKLYPALSQFMKPQYCLSLPGFRTSAKILHAQILKLIASTDKILNIFHSTTM